MWEDVLHTEAVCSYLAARYRETVLLGQRSSESVEAKSIYAFEILDSAWSMHAAMNGAVLSIFQDGFLMQVSRYLMRHSVENLDLCAYLGVDGKCA